MPLEGSVEQQSVFRLVGGRLALSTAGDEVGRTVAPRAVVAANPSASPPFEIDPERYDVSVIDEDPRLAPILRRAVALGLRREDSIEDGLLVCLIDGTRRKTISKHLRAAYGISFEVYARFFRLPPDYPTVAPGFQAERKLAAAAILGDRALETAAN